ncbi:MAG: cryptochrome/photolyase family protein [Rhodothermales bacterium]
MRHLILVLGDQLDADSSAFDGFNPEQDAVWMAEVAEESTHVWSHKARIALFLSAMRHFRDAMIARGRTVHYRRLDDEGNAGTLAAELAAAVEKLRPGKLILTEAGDWRVQASIEKTASALGVPVEIRSDRHFLCTREAFAAHVSGRKQLRMEYFYREMRRKTGVLMEGDRPIGGAWNYDAENRGAFGSEGPGQVAEPVAFVPDAITREVIALVEQRFANHPGNLAGFDWPVTRDQALAALRDFVTHRLPHFGMYQDAMWRARPGDRMLFSGDAPAASFDRRDAYLFHSRLSAALNLKWLDPREVIAAAEAAWRDGRAPLAGVEGFIRQILGWREYVRGIYGHFMPGYRDLNALDAVEPLPAFYWTGDTEMNCLSQVIRQTLAFGYAHHIQRLMVTGLYALLLGVRPQAVHAWYLAVYVDAVEWVELPNTIGMSQYGDGGLMASKPYVASGKYIQRMSNYCERCRFDPSKSTGDDACPFTTLYWDFLMRHEPLLAKNPRMALQVRSMKRLGPAEREAIRAQAARWRA